MRSADHRDSPLSSEDPAADINDVFVFVSPPDSTKVIFAMTVNGFAVPAVRSSYSFGTDVLYQFKIDTTGDAKEDLVIQATFDGFESLRDPRCPPAAGGQFLTVDRAGQAGQHRRRQPPAPARARRSAAAPTPCSPS